MLSPTLRYKRKSLFCHQIPNSFLSLEKKTRKRVIPVPNLLWEIFGEGGESSHKTCEQEGNCAQMQYWISFSTTYAPFQSYFLPVSQIFLVVVGRTAHSWWIIACNWLFTNDVSQWQSFFYWELRNHPWAEIFLCFHCSIAGKERFFNNLVVHINQYSLWEIPPGNT